MRHRQSARVVRRTSRGLPGLCNAAAVAGGGRHSLVMTTDGTVVVWGSNRHGEGTAPMQFR
jgi:alpha-tubulin suppressor-like RCC1 family protein